MRSGVLFLKFKGTRSNSWLSTLSTFFQEGFFPHEKNKIKTPVSRFLKGGGLGEEKLFP